MNAKQHILKKYNIKTDVIEIPNTTRRDLALLFHDLDFKIGAEIGVAAGQYSETIMSLNPQLKLYGVDPYEPYKGYKDYVKLSTYDKMVADAHARLDKFPGYEFVQKYSLEAADDFADGSLDFVYIDANHSEPFVTQDIEAWTPKVRKGGVVAGHDYARIKGRNGEDSTNWAVIGAIHNYIEKHDLELFVWGLEAKIEGLKRDASRSWMFIR